MSLCRGKRRLFALSGFLLGILAAGLTSTIALAQDEKAPKADFFLGYQWLNPGGNLPVPGTSNPVQGQSAPTAPRGGGFAFAYNFSRSLALEGDTGVNFGNPGLNIETVSVGPRLMWRSEDANIFIHTLFGWNRLNSPATGPHNGIGAILGGGIDLPVNKHFAIRLLEADYQWASQNFSNVVPPGQPDLRRPTFSGARLRSGLVFNISAAETAPPAASCSVQPAQVMVGEPITATATGSNFNPKHALSYTWAATGGKVTGKDNTASLDTNGVAGGSYTVTAHITDAKMKKGGEASCSASFTVKEPPKNPPTMSCSASPTSVQAGTASTITCTCTSPDNVPVTVAGWNASGGSVSGSGNAATLNTTGAAAGAISVSATCTDSRNLTSSSSSTVTVEAPPPPPVNELEVRLALHSIYFPTALPTAQKPNGGLLASQQQTLTVLASDFVKYLQTKPDAHLILEGHADVRGSVPYNQKLSERRVERTKSFLIERAVPAANIDTKALGDQHNLTADEVKSLVETNPELTPEERQRILRNMKTIIWASNRRVDITLSTTGQESVRHFPFNAADSLSLIGGREAARKKAASPTKKAVPPAKKGTKKK